MSQHSVLFWTIACFQLCGKSLEPFPVSRYNCPCAQARSTKFSEFCVEELNCPVHSPDLNPIEHLCDELKHQLRARPYHPTSVLDLTNVLVAELEQIPAARFPKILWKAEDWRLLQPHNNAHGLTCSAITL